MLIYASPKCNSKAFFGTPDDHLCDDCMVEFFYETINSVLEVIMTTWGTYKKAYHDVLKDGF